AKRIQLHSGRSHGARHWERANAARSRTPAARRAHSGTRAPVHQHGEGRACTARGVAFNMTYKLAAACIGLCITGTTPALAAEATIQRPEQVSSTERVSFASGGTIRFNDSFGDLYVEGWDQPQVEMTLIKLFQDYDAPKNAAERLERVKFTTEHPSPNELTIRTTIPAHSFFRHPFGGKGPVDVR